MLPIVYALDISDPSVNPTAQFTTIGSVLNVVVPILMAGAALAFLVMLLWAGFTILTAGGNSENVAKAQKMITWAVGGLVFVVASYTLIKLIGWILNISDKLPF